MQYHGFRDTIRLLLGSDSSSFSLGRTQSPGGIKDSLSRGKSGQGGIPSVITLVYFSIITYNTNAMADLMHYSIDSTR